MPDEVYECGGTYFKVQKPALVGGFQPREILFITTDKTVPAEVAALQIDIDRAVTTLDIMFPQGQ